MPHVLTQTVEINEFLELFKNFNNTATAPDIDNGSTHVFQEEILEKTNLFLKLATNK